MAFHASPEQQAIFDYMLAHQRDPGQTALAVAALAGTGKTTTIIEGIRRVNAQGIYCAFNKSIAEEVKPKLTGTKVEAKTFHSMGYGTLLNHLKQKHRIAKFATDDSKYKGICTEVVMAHRDIAEMAAVIRMIAEALAKEEHNTSDVSPEAIERYVPDVRAKMAMMLKELTRFARLKLTEWSDTETLRSLIFRYNLDEFENVLLAAQREQFLAQLIDLVPEVMDIAETETRKGNIDFTDMIYWNVRWNLQLPKYRWIFVDEAQDLSPMQREMVYRSQSPDCFTVIVGDENQAIYAFAGADSDSWDLTVAKFNATVLPLTVSRRCGDIIAEHARTIVPDFMALPEAKRGKIVWWDEERLVEAVKPGDLVVCRVKAPVIRQCLHLIAHNIPATVIGIDIGKSLVTLLEKIQKRAGFTFEKALEFIAAYGEDQAAKFIKKNDEARAEAIRDECQALCYIIEEMQPAPTSAADVSYHINNLFGESEESAAVVTFATGHKAKGLEAQRVFILAPEKMPLSYKKMNDEQLQQEDNLHYVAITRAIETLVILTNERYLYPYGKKNPPRVKPYYVQEDFADHDWTEAIVEEIEAEWREDALPAGWMNPDEPPSWIPTWSREAAEDDRDYDRPFPPDTLNDDEPTEEIIISPTGETPVYPPVLTEADLWEVHATTLPAPEPPVMVAPVIQPVPVAVVEEKFVATGNLQKDMQRYKDQTANRLYATMRKLKLEQAKTLRELLDDLIADLEAEAETPAAALAG